MNKIVEQVIDRVPSDIFSDTTLRCLVKGTSDSRHSLVKRAIKSGEIIHLRRGLYMLSKKYKRHATNLYEIAQNIYGPSYISFESALSYHGWIPEAVYTVTSACSKRSKEVKTPLGLFSYSHIPSGRFYTGVLREQSSEGIFLMATPWRALIDYIYFHKKEWKGFKPLIESLRVDQSNLQKVDYQLLDELSEAVGSVYVKKFVQSIKKEAV